jgi:hypothetical protein
MRVFSKISIIADMFVLAIIIAFARMGLLRFDHIVNLNKLGESPRQWVSTLDARPAMHLLLARTTPSKHMDYPSIVPFAVVLQRQGILMKYIE